MILFNISLFFYYNLIVFLFVVLLKHSISLTKFHTLFDCQMMQTFNFKVLKLILISLLIGRISPQDVPDRVKIEAQLNTSITNLNIQEQKLAARIKIFGFLVNISSSNLKASNFPVDFTGLLDNMTPCRKYKRLTMSIPNRFHWTFFNPTSTANFEL